MLLDSFACEGKRGNLAERRKQESFVMDEANNGIAVNTEVQSSGSGRGEKARETILTQARASSGVCC